MNDVRHNSLLRNLYRFLVCFVLSSSYFGGCSQSSNGGTHTPLAPAELASELTSLRREFDTEACSREIANANEHFVFERNILAERAMATFLSNQSASVESQEELRSYQQCLGNDTH